MNDQLLQDLEALRRFMSARGSVYQEYAPALEAALNELAERATQASDCQRVIRNTEGELVAIARRSCAPAQDRCCEHDSDCAVHNAPALPVGPCDCTLSEKPAQDQVAAVRAVPEGMPVTQEPKYGIRENRLFNRASGEFIPLDEPVFIFRARDKLAAQALTDYRFHCADEQHRAAIALRFIDFERFANDHPDRMKYPDTAAAPSPQPELSGSIDGPEFREKLQAHLLQYKRTMGLQGDKRAEFIAHIDAWKDAACAVAAEEARRDVHETNVTCVNNMLKAQQRATDAEAKLAAIQSQVAGDAQDAARYRWLKLQARIDERDGGYHKAYCLPHIEKESGTIGGKLLYHADFDSAVDAAMREQQP